MSLFRLPIGFLLATALTGCGAEANRTTVGGPVDPAMRLALEAPLLVDPALETQSRRFAIMSDPAPLDGSLPLDDFALATVAAARAEARRLSGPTESGVLGEVPCAACTAPTLALRSAALASDCVDKLVADLGQGAQMPASLPIYPRAHLREAGAAGGACQIKAASFTAPVSGDEALRFYRSLAVKSGFDLHAARGPEMSALLGKRASDGARFAVIAQLSPGKTSQIDLIVAGL